MPCSLHTHFFLPKHSYQENSHPFCLSASSSFLCHSFSQIHMEYVNAEQNQCCHQKKTFLSQNISLTRAFFVKFQVSNTNFKRTDKELFACNELTEINNMVCYVNRPSREQSPQVRNGGLNGELPWRPCSSASVLPNRGPWIGTCL